MDGISRYQVGYSSRYMRRGTRPPPQNRFPDKWRRRYHEPTDKVHSLVVSPRLYSLCHSSGSDQPRFQTYKWRTPTLRYERK